MPTDGCYSWGMRNETHPPPRPPGPTRPRPRPRLGVRALGAAALGVLGGGVLSAAAPPTADAAACDGGDRTHHVQTFRSDAYLNGHGSATNVAGGERWCDLWVEEEYVGPMVFLPQVCDYQSSVYVYRPDGAFSGLSSTSSHHGGCSWAGWFFHDSLDGVHAENTRFSTKWRSDATSGQFVLVGNLVD